MRRIAARAQMRRCCSLFGDKSVCSANFRECLGNDGDKKFFARNVWFVGHKTYGSSSTERNYQVIIIICLIQKTRRRSFSSGRGLYNVFVKRGAVGSYGQGGEPPRASILGIVSVESHRRNAFTFQCHFDRSEGETRAQWRNPLQEKINVPLRYIRVRSRSAR